MKAMQSWPYAQIPDNPTGWILRVAQNKMIDQLRREQKSSNEQVPDLPQEAHTDISLDSIQDDMVKMIFACCHPSLSQEHQIILTLKILGGLSIREISSSLMKREEAIAKAYTRAKKKFKKEEIKLQMPNANEIQNRLESVLKIIYLLFNEGYKSAEGSIVIKKDLCQEAIRQNHVLLENEICDTPSANALISLMYFHASRFDARIDQRGNIVSLEDQDRKKWDQTFIRTGMGFLTKALEDPKPNEYLIQASISAAHCRASRFEDTDWKNILALYDLQVRISPTPIIELNRVVALKKVHGPLLALKEIERLEDTQYFETYYLFFAIKAEILKDLGDVEDAKAAIAKAIGLAANEKEKEYLAEKFL